MRTEYSSNPFRNKESSKFKRNPKKITKKLYMSKKTPYLLSFLIDEYRFVLFTDGRAFIHGTSDVKIAKRLYAKYIG